MKSSSRKSIGSDEVFDRETRCVVLSSVLLSRRNPICVYTYKCCPYLSILRFHSPLANVLFDYSSYSSWHHSCTSFDARSRFIANPPHFQPIGYVVKVTPSARRAARPPSIAEGAQLGGNSTFQHISRLFDISKIGTALKLRVATRLLVNRSKETLNLCEKAALLVG